MGYLSPFGSKSLALGMLASHQEGSVLLVWAPCALGPTFQARVLSEGQCSGQPVPGHTGLVGSSDPGQDPGTPTSCPPTGYRAKSTLGPPGEGGTQ